MIPVPYSVIAGSLCALAVHVKVHKIFNRLRKKFVKRIFKKNKHDYYNIKSKLRKQKIFSEVKRCICMHSCPLPRNRSYRDDVVDTRYLQGRDGHQVSVNQCFLPRNHSPFTDKRSSIRKDQEEIESQAFEPANTKQVIDFQAATRQEQEQVFDPQILTTSDQDEAMVTEVYRGCEQVSQTSARSDQHQVLESLEVKREEQEQVIHSQEHAKCHPDQVMDNQVFVSLRLEDVNNHLTSYSQSFQFDSSNCSNSQSSLSTFKEETDGPFGSLNQFPRDENNDYLTPNFNDFQEDTNSSLSANLHYSEEESEATNLHQLQVEIDNNLAVHLYYMFTEEEKRNILFSPFSITSFACILLCDNVVEDYVYEGSAYSMFSQFNTLQFANVILVQKGFEVKQGDKEILADFFKTLLLEVDFLRESDEAVTCINEWINERTSAKIPMMVQSLDPSTFLYNAAYFKATWTHPFDKMLTSLQIFYNCGEKGDTKVIDMMYKTEHYSFYEDEDLQALELPCNEEEATMLILLPRAKDGLELVEASLSPSFIKDLKIKLQKTKVLVAFPRFRLEYTKRLDPYLHHLVADIGLEANSGIAWSSSDVAASGTMHKVVLQINENGCNTEAKVTEATNKMDYFFGFNTQFIADHPFVFVIFDQKSDFIFLMGRVTDP